MSANLGTAQRVIRFSIALVLAIWLMLRGNIDALSGVLMLATVFLVFNAVSGRCYLWHYLGIARFDKKAD